MTAPSRAGRIPWLTLDRIETAALWSLLAALCVQYLLPLWTARYLPMLDLPVHLQMASAIHNLHDPALGFHRYFELRGGVLPYWTYYGLVHLFAYLLPIDAANKVVLSLTALGMVGAVLLCLRAFGRSLWLVFLCFPFIYDVNVTYGYFAFRLSVVLCLACLALVRLDLARPRLWLEVLLALLAAATFLCHAHGFALLAVLGAAVWILCAPGLVAAGRVLAAALPALVLAATWYLPVLFGGPPGARTNTVHLPLIRLMELVPHRALNSIADNSDEAVALGLLVVWLGLVLASPRPGSRSSSSGARATLAAHAPEILTGLLLLAYFTVPNQILSPTQAIYGINYRFLLPLGLVAVVVPRVELRRWRLLALVPVLLLVGYYGLVITREYRAFNRRYRDFDRVVAAMRPARRVMAFTYQTWDRRFTVPMLGHFVGYYVARRGGVPSSAHTFATYSYMPVKLIDPRAHPEPNYRGPLNWPLMARCYDYFLVCDGPASHRTPFDPRPLRLVVQAGPWQVYEKR